MSSRERAAQRWAGSKTGGNADGKAGTLLTRGLRLAGAGALLCALGCRMGGAGGPAGVSDSAKWARQWEASNHAWRGVHLMVQGSEQANTLMEALPKLASNGVNAVIIELDYAYEFQSHPEVRSKGFVTRQQARALAAAAHAQGIRLIPQVNCLGHQSWSKNTLPLLAQHPEFDETPGQFPENKGIYCRSWCPQNPEVNRVVFDLIDELIDGFEADAVHVGMDEVFLIASEYCPRCRGGDPARLFAKAVNDLHDHIVKERKLEMLMWGDRFLDANRLKFSEWEAAKNGTQGAVDLVPKDIILCDWHYEKRDDYPSVPFLLSKGFRVWPSGWQPLEATEAFSRYAATQKNPRMLGYLCTTWGKVKLQNAADWPCLTEPLKDWR